MNIGYYSHYFSPEIGAPSARVHEMANGWLAQGHRIQVVTCFPNHPSGKVYPGYKSAAYMNEEMDGIHVHRHWTYITPNNGIVKRTVGHISYLPSAILFSNPHVTDLDVVIGTSPTFFAAGAAAVMARRRRVPFIMEVRDLWPAIFVELGILRNRQVIRSLERIELALYREATRVITVTESFRHNLIDRGVPADKVVTIPNGADLETWSPCAPSEDLRRRLGLDNCFVILYAGNHGISQRLGQVLDAARHMRNNHKIRFLLVGDGPEKRQLAERARAEDLTNVQFHEAVGKHDLRAFYALADVCLVTLRNIPLFDTFIPSKMFEIMAMAKPLVAAVHGESAEILKRSGGAVIVAPEDGAAIARAILDLYHNPASAAAKGQEGRAFVVEHYSRRSLSEKYVDVMVDAICGR